MRGIEAVIPLPATSKALFTKPSAISITESTVANAISISTCVNSGCLSALRSSSLKQRAIWKYFSNPDIISNCLNN